MIIEISFNESLEFRKILPGMGSWEELQVINSLLNKTCFSNEDMNNFKDNSKEPVKEVELSKDDIKHLKSIIQERSQVRQLPYSAFSLIDKILSIKG